MVQKYFGIVFVAAEANGKIPQLSVKQQSGTSRDGLQRQHCVFGTGRNFGPKLSDVLHQTVPEVHIHLEKIPYLLHSLPTTLTGLFFLCLQNEDASGHPYFQ